MGIAQFWASTVGKKIVMAVTGLIMIGFLVTHVAANLLAFLGPEHINAYSAFLHAVPEILWPARAVLLVSVVLHVIAAVQLTAIDRAARPAAYVKHRHQAATFASRTIRWGGLLLLVFILYHLLHMTLGTVHPAFTPHDPYRNIVTGLAVRWVAGFYVVAMIALGLHLYHGTWASVRTLGVQPPSADPLRRRLVTLFAILVAGGFAAIPIAVVFGVIR